MEDTRMRWDAPKEGDFPAEISAEDEPLDVLCHSPTWVRKTVVISCWLSEIYLAFGCLICIGTAAIAVVAVVAAYLRWR